ncbi:MAG: DUF3488 domain-containing transglutaminase family protein [Nitrospirae bacterium]|nr:DUF3488 domain-containing transglutaminase family protein [Nitrospirota bacterium]
MKTDFKVEQIVKLISYLTGLTGFVSVSRHVSYSYSLLFLSLLILSLVFEKKNIFFFPRWLLNAIASAFILMTVLNTTYANLIEKVIEMLLFLLAVKFLEDKKSRDHLQIYAIAVFLLLGSALLSVDLLFLAYFLTLIFLCSLAVIFLAYLSEEPSLRMEREVCAKVVSKALLIPVFAIPLTMVFFILLPRPFSPLLKVPVPGQKGVTGFSEGVKLGEVSEIQEDDSTVFRVNMREVPSSLLYWRGIVFDYFDGRGWSMSNKSVLEKMGRHPVSGEEIEQTVFLEPYNHKYLFALDIPISVNNTRTSRVFTSPLPRGIQKRIRYEAVSVFSERIAAGGINEDIYLQLYDGISSAITDLAKRITAGRSGRAKIDSILEYFAKEKFRYSMEGLPVSSSPLEDFLFRLRYGNCEYFASSTAVMLRAAGIPARVVGGFKGAEYNEMGAYYLVQQRNAHLWVEAYVKGEGWVRVDPTPSTRELFIEEGRRDIFFRMKQAFDVANYFWNGFVIDYDLRRQFSIFLRIGEGIKKPAFNLDLSIEKEKAGHYFIVFMLIVLLAAGFVMLLTRRMPQEMKIIGKFHKKMKRYGYERMPNEGLEEFVSRIGDEDLRSRAEAFAADFGMLYYKDQKFTRVHARRLSEKIKEIKPGKAKLS